MLQLTKSNYHSLEANREYMSVSGFKSYLPQYGGCEAMATAKSNGEWQDEDKKAFLVGSYVHAWNEGAEAFREFIAENEYKLYKKKGTGLLKDFMVADVMIETLRNDPFIEKVREGQKEVIMTAEMYGMPWKIMIDIYNPDTKTFTDLKTAREIRKTYWNEQTRQRENFILYYGYDIQMAVYAEVERLSRQSGEYFNPHILVVSKEDIPDKEVINFGTGFIAEVLVEKIEPYIERVREVWKGEVEPIRCESCDYCRSTKKLKKTVFYMDI